MTCRAATVLALLLSACGGSTTDRAHLLGEAAARGQRDPLTAVPLCEQLGGSEGAECLALTAAEQAKHDLSSAREICARIDDGMWHDECAFLAAETARPRVGAEASALACQDAGRFADNCLMHVWKTWATELLDAEPIPQAAARYGAASDWGGAVVPFDDRLERRFWDTFFDVVTQRAGAVDLAACDELTGELYPRCRSALPTALERALNRAARRPGAHIDSAILCDASRLPSDRVESVLQIRYVPDPSLDGTARRFVARHCSSAETPR